MRKTSIGLIWKEAASHRPHYATPKLPLSMGEIWVVPWALPSLTASQSSLPFLHNTRSLRTDRPTDRTYRVYGTRPVPMGRLRSFGATRPSRPNAF